MIMTPTNNARPRLRLILIQHRQQTENQRDASVELYAHEALGYALGDVFEVHGLTFYEDPDGDYGVEGAGGGCGFSVGGQGERGQVGGGGAKEVAGTERGGRCGLDLRGGIEFGAGDGELPATRHGLDDDVGFLYAGGEKLGLGAS